jgi:hypothetical protein
MQEQLMKYSPDTGEERPYPSNAKQWREYHGRVAWLYNPWTGKQRDLLDIGSDVLGELIVPDKVILFKAEGPWGVTPCQQETAEVSPNYCCEVEIPESNVLYDLGEKKVYSHHSKTENSPRGLADKLLRDFPTTDKVLTEKEMVILKSVEQAEKLVGCKLLYGWWAKHLMTGDMTESLSRNKNMLTYRLGNTMTEFVCTNEAVAETVMQNLMPVKTSDASYSGTDTYQNTNRYHGADVILVGGDPISRKRWNEVYGSMPTPSEDVMKGFYNRAVDALGKSPDLTIVKPVSQTLDDTEAMILEAVQSAERLLLGTTTLSYWVKFPLATKVNSKLTREKDTLVYVSGKTKTKYYCATENVAILAQSSVVLLDDDKAKTVEQTT